MVATEKLEVFKKVKKEAEKYLKEIYPVWKEISNNMLPAIQNIDFPMIRKVMDSYTQNKDTEDNLPMLQQIHSEDYYSNQILISEIKNLKKVLQKRIPTGKAKKTPGKIEITLTKYGELKRGKFICEMKTSKKRVAILKTLNQKPTLTDDIQIESNSLNNKAVRKAIGEINAKAGYNLKLKHRLIESKGEGYYINPIYKLIRK
ncbi:MAG: hypothetical protein WC536_05085 [Patescibacteria group bacterium]